MAVDINTSKTNVENVSVWMRAISGKEMHDRDLAFQHETHALMIAARHADAAEAQVKATEQLVEQLDRMNYFLSQLMQGQTMIRASIDSLSSRRL